MRYPVTITPDDGQFTVTFPDVPEAVTFGNTREEAFQRAPDALLTIFDAFMKDRRAIPAPSATAGDAVELPALDSAKIELYRAMTDARVGKSELAKRLRWHLPQVDRVLKIKHGSQLEQMEAAFAVLGKRLVIAIEDDEPAPMRARGRRAGIHPGVLLRHERSSGRHTSTATHASTVRRTAGRKAAKKR